MEQTTFRALKDEYLPATQLVKLVTQPALLSTAVIDSTRPVFICWFFFFLFVETFSDVCIMMHNGRAHAASGPAATFPLAGLGV